MSYMYAALEEAYKGIRNGDGGPFGAAVVKDGKIIGQGHNMVLSSHDPTMHGEISAIRDACKKLNSHDLRGCTLYTTAYPCPMCLSASLWAGIDRIVYGCTASDTAGIGFRDEDFYRILRGETEENAPQFFCEEREKCLELFGEYSSGKGERY